MRIKVWTFILCIGLVSLLGCSQTSQTTTETETTTSSGTISGTLYRTTGEPASNINIKLYKSSALGLSSWQTTLLTEVQTPLATTETNTQGTFHFDAIPYDSYTIVAESNAESLQGFYNVTLSTEETSIGELQFLENGTISGNVSLSDEASPLGISVFIPGTPYYSLTDTNGHFTLTVPQGTYTVYMMKSGYTSHETTNVAVSINTTTTLDDVTLDIDTSATATAIWHTGEGTPSSSLGNTGDFYLDTLNNNFYIKSESGWNLQGVLNGEAGADGAQGPTGNTGTDGTDGANGTNGADGESAYFYVVYSDYSDGTSFTTTYNSQIYMGTLSTHNVYSDSELAALNKSVYTWIQIVGTSQSGISVDSITTNNEETEITLNITIYESGTFSRIELYGGYYGEYYSPTRLGYAYYSGSGSQDIVLGPVLYSGLQVAVVDENNNRSTLSDVGYPEFVNDYSDNATSIIDITCDTSGVLYILEYISGDYVVSQVDSTYHDETDSWILTSASAPSDIEWNGGVIYVTDSGLNKIYYFSDTESATSVSTTFDGTISGGGSAFTSLENITVTGDSIIVSDGTSQRSFYYNFSSENSSLTYPDSTTANAIYAFSDSEFIMQTADNALYVYISGSWTQLATYGEEFGTLGDVIGFVSGESYFAIISDQDNHKITLYYIMQSSGKLYKVFETRQDTIGITNSGDVYAPSRLMLKENRWGFLRGDNHIEAFPFFKSVGIHVQ